VIDYRVSTDQATNTWVVIVTGITSQSFTMTTVTAGLIYNFRVESRSLFGYSSYSQIYPILAATVPDQPSIPTTSVHINNLIVDWQAPYDQGSPIIGYRIYIRAADGVSFAEELTHCDGSDLTIRTNTVCSIPLTLI